jgi:hypothetical protein
MPESIIEMDEWTDVILTKDKIELAYELLYGYMHDELTLWYVL